MNSIEPSKSSRAGCRTCKSKIGKGEARLGVETQFNMGGETVTSLKWHHLSCAMDKIPDEVLVAEVKEEVTSRGKPISLSEEDLEKIEEFKQKHQKSGIAILGISDVIETDKTVNITAKVLRGMSASTRETNEGEELWGKTVYVIDDGNRSRINLWEDHASIELERDDTIVILGAKSYMGSNDKIQFNAFEDAEVLVNPEDSELDELGDDVSLYVSDAWDRPPGEPAEFTLAPSGRASCQACGNKISKGQLKIVKPGFIEIDRGGKKFTVSGSGSYHPLCILDDEDAMEVLHEVTSRLTLDQIDEHLSTLEELMEKLPEDTPAYEILSSLLENQ